MGKFYNYKSDDKYNLSLRYSAIGCECGTFSNIFDTYSDDLKKALLINTQTNYK